MKPLDATATPIPAGERTHVLQVIGNAIVGGMETWVERLVERLPAQQFVVSALCPFESPYTDRLRERGVDVHITPMPPENPPWASIQLAHALIVSHGVDVLHAHLPNAHLLAGLAARLAGKPLLTTIHGRQLTTLDLEVHRAVGSHLAVVCRPSYFHALGLGVERSRLSLTCNGVDTQVFQPRPRSGAGPLRTALALPPATPLVGQVGRLSWEKGPEVFVRAALLLKARAPQAHCVLVGEGPMEGTLRAMIRQFGLADRVHLAGVRHDMPGIYGDLDVAVSSSHSEAMPLALMEAMASGLPVVATRVGGVADMVEHGQTGWLVNAGDHDDIAERAGQLLGATALRAAMGERARARAVERYGLTESMARVAQLLQRLARLRGDQGPPAYGHLATIPNSAATSGTVAATPQAIQSRPRRQ